MEKKEQYKYFVGHRGSGGVGVENTLEAFMEGIKRGYPALECDIRVTKDNKIIIFHDADLIRLANIDKKITDLTLNELKEINLVQEYNGKVLYGKIPTLLELLQLSVKYNVRPIIELKWAKGINSNDQSNVSQLIEVIRSSGIKENFTILTSMKEVLFFIKKNYEGIDLQFLIGGNVLLTEENIQFAFDNKISLDVEYDLITPDLVKKVHNQGLIINSWTVNDEEIADKLFSYNVDMVTTDILVKK